MSDKVKRYRDDNKYHASGAEHALSKFEETLEKSDFEESQKILIRATFRKGFDLGFACANEYYENKLADKIREISNMSATEIKTYSKLVDALSRFEFDYDVDKGN